MIAILVIRMPTSPRIVQRIQRQTLEVWVEKKENVLDRVCPGLSHPGMR